MKVFLKITVFLIFLCAFSAIISAGKISHAQAINNNAASADNATPLDLNARKQILNDVLTESNGEIKDLETKLNSLNLNNNWNDIRQNFLNNLSDYQDYYQKKSDEIANATTVDEIKSIAKSLKNWRENIYSPKLEEITNLFLLSGNSSLLNITQNRIDKISDDINKIDKQHLMKTDDLKNYFAKANKYFQNSKKFNSNANNLYFQEETASQDAASTTENATSSEINSTSTNQIAPDNGIDIQISVRNLIEKSLKEIKATYEIFFQMNNQIKKSL